MLPASATRQLQSSLSWQTQTKGALDAVGGTEGLAKKLSTSLQHGLSPVHDSLDLQRRREVFGENKFRVADTKAFWSLVFENLQDPTLVLLMAAALVRRPSHTPFGSHLLLKTKAATRGSMVASALISTQLEKSSLYCRSPP